MSTIVTTTLQSGVGILRSLDGGLTWTQSSFTFSLVNSVAVYDMFWHPAKPDVVFACTSLGLYISTDNGETWQAKSPFRTFSIVIDPIETDTWYISNDGIGIQKTIDAGNTWTILSNGLPSGGSTFRSELAICDSQPNIIYANMVSSAGFGALGVFKSVDRGDSWIALPNVPAFHCQPGNPANCAGWLFNTIGVSPSNPDIVMIGSVQFWRSEDGGLTWEWLDYVSNGSGGSNAGLTYVDHWDIDFDLNNPETVYSCNDGGIQKSMNSGEYWERKANDLIIAQTYSVSVAPYDSNFIIGGFHDNGHQRLIASDSNLTWKRWGNNDGIKTLFDPTNTNVIYGNIQNGVPYKNISQGSTSTTTSAIVNGLQVLGPWISPFIMHPDSSNILLLGMNDGINRTNSGGNLWSLVQPIANTTISQMTFDLANPAYMYAHSFSGSSWDFWISDNYGYNWRTRNSSNMPSWGTTAIATDPQIEGRIYISRNSTMAGRDHIKASYDHGTSWIDITSNLPDVGVFSLLVSPTNSDVIYAGTDVGVFVTVDGGEDWAEFNNNLPRVRIMDISYSELEHKIYVASMGRGVWATSEIGRQVLVATQDFNGIQSQITLFPNPVVDYIDIKIDSQVTVKQLKFHIYNSAGQRIRYDVKQERIDSNTIRLHLDFGFDVHLENGQYFLQISNENMAKGIPFIKN